MGLPENFLPTEKDYIILNVQLRRAENITLGGGWRLWETIKGHLKTHSSQKFTSLPLEINCLHIKADTEDKLIVFLIKVEIHQMLTTYVPCH